MKDNKFTVLCCLGLVWLVVFVAMLFGAKIHPRFELVISLICAGWFIYWTLSVVVDYIKTLPDQSTKQPTETKTETNEKEISTSK